MLNFRSASTLVIILAVVVILLMIVQPDLWWILAGVIGIYLLALIIGSAGIRSGFYLKAICKGKTAEKLATLTFDDGPDENITPKVLAILEKHEIKAAFFVIGKKAKKNVKLLKQIISSGHLAGLHSYSHSLLFDLYRKKTMEQDLLKAEDVITCNTGKKPLFFRPPYGVTNPVLAKVVKKLGYVVIGWSVRSLDTTIKDAEKVTNRVMRKLHPGAVILMHDTQEVTPEALEKVITGAKEKGYRFVGLEELLGIEAFEN
jgi:peptidoglycan/xylan/chitin deacetylase (PgdA/CDA1 family)